MLPSTAVDHYRLQQGIATQAAGQVNRLWSTMSTDLDASWSRIAPAAVETTTAAQIVAASTAGAYVGAVLAETGVDAPSVADIQPTRFAGVSPDGRSLATLMDGAVVRTKESIGRGAAVGSALLEARGWLEMTVLDSVRSANRQAASAAIAARPAVQGWVRMLNPPSCKYCVMLAGKWFRWNEGFQSHPHCDCRHIPSQESTAGDLTVDPYAYFNSIGEKSQDRIFGKRDAQAIRDGADMYRVVNIRSRGLSTSRAGRKFKTPSRMTVDDVYARAATREEAVKLLADEGFITGPQVAGGNILGNENTNAAVLAAGRGRGTIRVGTETVTTKRAARYDAIASGQRDRLNRSTMTAGERRVYDDFYRAEQALLGRAARTIGPNTADRGSVFSAITGEQADALQMAFLRRIERVRRNGSAQEKRLAELLWRRYNSLV